MLQQIKSCLRFGGARERERERERVCVCVREREMGGGGVCLVLFMKQKGALISAFVAYIYIQKNKALYDSCVPHRAGRT